MKYCGEELIPSLREIAGALERDAVSERKHAQQRNHTNSEQHDEAGIDARCHV